MTRVLRHVESVVSRGDRGFGHKAQNLAKLARSGFPVPLAWALSGSALSDVLAQELTALGEEARGGQEGWVATILQGWLERDHQVGFASLRARIEEVALPGYLLEQLQEAMHDLEARGADALAVRSSSSLEDDAARSGAGVHDSVIGVRTQEGVEGAIRRCWGSLLAPKALAYRRQFARDSEASRSSWSMGVVLQAMVPAEVSGVVFTANPITGNRDEVLIHACYGLGSLLVEGAVAADMWTFQKSGFRLLDHTVGEKAKQRRFQEQLVEEEVPGPLRARSCLSAKQLEELLALCLQVEARFACPQDVEWSIANGKVYVLQARPISAPSFRRRLSARSFWSWAAPSPAATSGSDASRRVWSRSNVGEALPGVVTPLTWSVLSSFSEKGFQHVLGRLGLRPPRDTPLVGNVRGRIYLNMTDLLGTLSLFPGMNQDVLAHLAGDALALPTLPDPLPSRRSARASRQIPTSLLQALRGRGLLGAEVRALERRFQEERERFLALDLRVLSPYALSKALWDVERLLEVAGSVLLSSYARLLLYSVMWSQLLPRMLRSDQRPSAEEINLRLLSQLDGVVSAGPGQALREVAKLAAHDSPFVTWCRETTPSFSQLPAGPAGDALKRLLEAHGHRGPREAELAAPRFREDPSMLAAALCALVDQAQGQPDWPGSPPKPRPAAEALDALNWAGRLPMKRLLARMRYLLRLREALRSHVVEVLGMIRVVALEVDRRFAAIRPGWEEGDVFFLTSQEMHRVLEHPQAKLPIPLTQRKAQFKRYQSLPEPPNAFVGKPDDAYQESTEQQAGGATLMGVPCAAGIGVGPARCLTSPDEAASFEAGEVLVVPHADVGWTPLFAAAAAVVTELGGPLSHAAVVARELSVPLVGNVPRATRHVRTGERLRVNGHAGRVERLDANGSS